MNQTNTDQALKSAVPDWETLFGPPPVFSSEDVEAYNKLKSQVLACLSPKDVLASILVKDFINSEWEVRRLLRHKALLPERKFRVQQEYQEARAKLMVQRTKPKESPTNDEERLYDLEEIHSQIPNDAQDIFKQAANERDHANGLEAGFGYYELLDKRIQVAMSRRNDSLWQLKQHRDELWSRSLDRIIEESMGPPDIDVPAAPIVPMKGQS